MSSKDNGRARLRRLPVGAGLSAAFDGWRARDERWLFISPHDDDVALGAGLLLQKAVEEGVDLSIVITTDGSMGYRDLAQREGIAEIRRAETIESFALLGVRDVRWLGFPDCDVARYLGRRRAERGERGAIEGFTGLQNAYVHVLRALRPNRVFLASGSDFHPDHKNVYQEALISLFHAQGDVWPELGPSIEELPRVYEMPIYRAFDGRPDIEIEADAAHLERKLEAIAVYRSQARQIELLVANLRSSRPLEYLKATDFAFYTPEIYSEP